MDALVASRGPDDRRALFLGAYRSMSASMISAGDAGEFADSEWVDVLLRRFADYYFRRGRHPPDRVHTRLAGGLR